jgi:biopolymer transport protein ExbD
MSGKLSQDIKAEPNLTPLLDMVFQLITFFMLVISFKSAELDMSLNLPVVGSARPVDTKGQRDLLVLNIDNTGNLKLFGRPIPDYKQYIASESVRSQMSAGMTAANLEAGEELPTTVVIRADRATPFKMLYRVIKACQENGFREFALKALDKPPPKER